MLFAQHQLRQELMAAVAIPLVTKLSFRRIQNQMLDNCIVFPYGGSIFDHYVIGGIEQPVGVSEIIPTHFILRITQHGVQGRQA